MFCEFVPPKRRLFVVAVVATAVPQIIFLAGVAPYFCTVESPRGWSVLAVGLFIIGAAWACYLVAALSDPGWVRYQPEHEKYLLYREASSGLPLGLRVRDPRSGEELVLKYCETCRVFRPPRTKHCWVCQRCCVRMDHHCVWLGQCVGARNHRFFLGYLVFILLTLIYGVVVCFLQIGLESERLGGGKAGFRAALVNRPHPAILALIVGVYCLLVGAFISALYLVQLFFACTGRTTAEACGHHPVKRGSRVGPAGLVEVLCVAPKTQLGTTKGPSSTEIKRVWQYEIIGVERSEHTVHSAVTGSVAILNDVYDARWSAFEKLRDVYTVPEPVANGSTALSSERRNEASAFVHFFDRHELMLIRQWIMGGMTEPTLERHPHEDQQDVECERRGRDLLRSLVNGERTVVSEQDVDMVREMLAIWRRRLHYRNALLESKHATDEDGALQQTEDLEPDGSHLNLAGTRTRQERIICTSCNGRVTMTDSCSA